MTENKPTLREIRDRVYGQKSTDKNWDGCRENWEKDPWLREQYEKETNGTKTN